MKKLLALVLSLVLVCSMITACGKDDAKDGADDFKVGFIFVGDESEGYTLAHYNGVKEMMKSLNLSEDQVLIKWMIPEGEQCFDAACELAEAGCKIIFANSFGHESYMIQAAEKYPDIQFCHATGYQAVSSGLSNMHNYFTSIYESRFASGIVAGIKLNELVANQTVSVDDLKIGYVGAYSYAEVVSGFTSFYLGVLYSCDYDVTMDVQYTGSWASQSLEKEAAEALIANGCVLVSQHADTTGAPSACESAGVFCVGYNVDMIPTAPKCALTSAANNWGPYYTYATKAAKEGTAIDTDWCKGYAEGAVDITAINADAFTDSANYDKAVQAVKDAFAGINAGTLHVFDTSTWTVDGATLDTYKKEGIDVEYISDGYFHESEFASAPAFDIIIDGITQLNTVY